jgi:chromosome partitioning protein
MRIISIINQKGGCGKTTSAINLAGITARKGFRTLLVDLDPQSHCAAGLAIPEQRIDLDIGDVMLLGPEQAIDPARLFWRASRNLDLAPSRMKLAGLESARGGLAEKPDKERRLSNVLARFARNYDICLVDCSPSIGLLTFNALAAATDVLIPVETSFFALQGATKQVSTIKSLSKRLGSTAPYWLMATIHDEGSVLACDLLDELRRRFLKRVVPHVIRRDPTLKEAASFGQPIIEYAPTSTGARDYTALADWLIETIALSHDSRPRIPEPLPVERDGGDPPSVEVVGSMETKLAIGRKLVGMEEEPSIQPHAEASETSFEPSPSVNHDSGSSYTIPMDPPTPSDAAISKPAADTSSSSGAVAVIAPPQESREVILAFDGEAAEAAAISRAEDMAQRARVMLLKRADDRLRSMLGETAPIEEVKPIPPVVSLEASARARADQIRELFGVRQTKSGVLFVQPISTGLRISVAGDFNGWSSTASVMKRNEQLGVFELCTPIRPGRHRYRLVIDGRWASDPFNNNSEPNEFNELNSIVEVE